MQVATAIGELEFTTLQSPPGGYLSQITATPYGPVAIGWATHVGGALRWSTDYKTWEGITLSIHPSGIIVTGDDVIVYGGQDAARYAWNGSGWAEVAHLDTGLVLDMAFGPRGAVVLSDTLRYSSDGVHFANAERAPSKDLLQVEGSGGCTPMFGIGGDDTPLGQVLPTEAGFVALTPAHSADWWANPTCEPLLWFSANGSTWDLVSPDSPFGPAAFVRDVAEYDGRFVAIGGVGQRGAVWVSDDGLTWERADVDLGGAFAVAGGEMGWMLTGQTEWGWDNTQQMWFSPDGLTWDGPYALPDGLWTVYIPPQFAVGSDAIFAVGPTPTFVPVVARLQD